MAKKYRLLIGGLGDDAHSVGISLLGLCFKQEGFAVQNIGIRNTVDEVLRRAADFDLIMLSNNNGHAELYLQDFARKMNHYRLTVRHPQLWYIGGNLSVSGAPDEITRRFLRMGFTRVYPKPVRLESVISDVYEDFARFNIQKRDAGSRYEERSTNGGRIHLDEVNDDYWPLERLEAARRGVLLEWETGRDVRLDGEGYIRPPAEKDLARVLSRAKRERREPLVQPRTGVADLASQVEILKFLEASGIEIASVQLDAASRSKLYAEAKTGVIWSKKNGGSFLNGFPVPVHGVKGIRRIVDAVGLPFQLRAGGPDHRLTYEIALAGGATGVEGGFICYLFPYDKLTRPSDCVKYWQYVDRLCAWYGERHHVSINREYFGTLTANLIAPALAIAINIVQAILSAKQGVRSISLGYAEQGNRAQDIAAILTLEKLGNQYLAKYGFPDRRVTTVFHQFMAAFPKDEAKAEDLIYNSAVTAALARATKVMTKTPVEASKIPSARENAWGIAIVKRGLRAAAHQTCDWNLVQFERGLIEREVTEIFSVIEELGNGSIARGAIRAFEEGYLDIPFSPNVYNHNEVVTLRDRAGAIRFAEFGNLPFSTAIKDFHRARIDERKTLERDSKIASLLEKDLTRIWKNDFRGWPLDSHYVY